MKPNFSESFGLTGFNGIEISNWSYGPDSFGLIWFDRIQSDSFELQVRIDFDWALDWFRLKTNLGLDRNEIVWCGYKFRNNSDWFGMNLNSKLSPEKVYIKKYLQSPAYDGDV